ncbi:hypothetical protein AB0E75_29475 [Streptomyces griseoviridis]|jgi:hypothetical protein|uniref:Uncharacterized protein n=3 Tax=Streptomyces TaxID=1883 RepID=A0A918LKE6_STRGD|nr:MULTISPECIES: hypothetical protein [Streptomyces]MDP9679763.1 hypothetical protein [Streptomyces griseoviridis]GGS67628.1 hypothetical protein GCM10010238_65450 [Streptomyces niveoruber]GGT22227.1 hypothetical protein GCM10010240_63670 [Streptomyces griseoviridis]GGU63651.1 hypothetical protein GCM10010259_62660 [Streptomyces daghestanicus]GHI30037.1 hypothetical protein Sdagh_17670 [Streptomyces daghestanicus]
MLSYRLDHEVLVITVERDPGIGGRADLANRITDLVDAHRPSPVVVVLADPATGGAAVSAVLRAHQHCGRLGVLMSVVSHSAPLRRLLENNADTRGLRLVVHARADAAIAGSFAAAA